MHAILERPAIEREAALPENAPRGRRLLADLAAGKVREVPHPPEPLRPEREEPAPRALYNRD